MLIWGTGGDVKDLGNLTDKHCETCERERPFKLLVEYRTFGFYWIFNFLTHKKYWLLCEICHRGWELHKSEVESRLAAVPIPFMARYGMAVLVGAFVSAIAVAQVIARF